ncbi:MAG: hypothetical protein ACTHJM_15920 [Marmoricola sp.]
MGKLAKEQTTTKRKVYVQRNFLRPGITLEDLRDLVAATEDYDMRSEVILEDRRVTVIETRQSIWSHKGREGAA